MTLPQVLIDDPEKVAAFQDLNLTPLLFHPHLDFQKSQFKVILLKAASIMTLNQSFKQFIKDFKGFFLIEPGDIPAGFKLKLISDLLPYCDLLMLTPEVAEALTGLRISNHEQMEKAAACLLDSGVRQLLIFGECLAEPLFYQDYMAKGGDAAWINGVKGEFLQSRQQFVSAIAAWLALGFSLKDALVIGKMIANAGQSHLRCPLEENLLPFLSAQPLDALPRPFPSCPLGLYPVVNSSRWVEKLAPTGIQAIQLRIKSSENLRDEINKSLAITRQYGINLFVNDDWEAAIAAGANGVHLGQDDLKTANIDAIRRAGLLLGISTQSHHEVARAHRFAPSYIACGPIFATQSKWVPEKPQGLEALRYWRTVLSSYPLVAIGGIHQENFKAVRATAVEGIAVIAAICDARDPLAATRALLF